jgi:hypothetical protein
MRRGAKPTKPKVKAKLPVSRKALKNESARVRGLERRLAEALKREKEAQKREAEALDIPFWHPRLPLSSPSVEFSALPGFVWVGPTVPTAPGAAIVRV